METLSEFVYERMKQSLLSEITPSFIKLGLKIGLCKFGRHEWEAEPRTVDPIELGMSILFWNFGKQTGVQHCSRCSASRTVRRTGIVGMGGKAGAWEPYRK